MRQHYEATAAHDPDWLMATMAPERARLYDDARTVDKRRLTVAGVRVLTVEPVTQAVPAPAFAARYQSTLVLRAEFELDLVPPEQRRDPSLAEGRGWSYFILVSEGPGKPWLIADWGK